MSSTIGIPVPRLLPITGTWTLPFAAYLVLLSNRVYVETIKDHKDYDEDTEHRSEKSQVDTRAHGSYLSYVPLAFSLITIAELNGGRRQVLNYAMGSLFAVRVLHVELGSKSEEYKEVGRRLGFFGSQAFLLGMGGYCTWLVKGYWGF